MTVGERIKELRTSLGLSQVDFADKINVSKQTLYKYENNIITNIPSDKIEAAARIGKVSPAYLMGWDSWGTVTSLISNEIKRVSDQTNLYIQLFESYGYRITLKPDTVDVQTKTKKTYTFKQKDFMAMIQRCYKDISYNIERLIDEYDNIPADTGFNTHAAHARTDVEQTSDGVQHDLNIMNDDSEWE